MPTLAEGAKSIVADRMNAALAHPQATPPAGPSNAEARTWLREVCARKTTYRDGLLALLAFPVAADKQIDLRKKDNVPGIRGVSQEVERLLTRLNIACMKDAFQTIAKGSDSLIGRDLEAWNKLLEWASRSPPSEVDKALRYVAFAIARTARDIPSMPDLAPGRLTFAAVTRVFDSMLEARSGGAHEQFIIAALQHAIAQAAGRRVTTKPLNAADASAGTAGDIQILDEGGISEAYEVSANHWKSKLPHALKVMDQKQLPRIHIVASVELADGESLSSALNEEQRGDADVSVLDVRHEARSLVARLRKDGREAALRRLYEHLRDLQPNDDLVRAFVRRLSEAHLTTSA